MDEWILFRRKQGRFEVQVRSVGMGFTKLLYVFDDDTDEVLVELSLTSEMMELFEFVGGGPGRI